MAVPTADALRLLNLAYRKMQEDFSQFYPDLFRSSSDITSNASGYILLPTNATKIEMIVTASNTDERWYLMRKEAMYWGTGYYEDGYDSSSGKRRVMVRDSGAAKASTQFTVHYTLEFSDLTATTDPTPPFVGKRYLDMMTTLQAYYYYIELGEEKAKDAQIQFDLYNRLLSDAKKDVFDKGAVYGMTRHGDAGATRRYPILHPSSS